MRHNARMRKRRWFWRTVVGAALLGVPLLTVYWRATSPQELRARVERLIARLDLRILGLSDIQFSPWRGLELFDLSLDYPAGTGDARTGNTARAGAAARPALLHIPYLCLKPRIDALLLGRFEIREALLRRPALAYVCKPRNAPATAEPLQCVRPDSLDFSRAWTRLPRIVVERGDIALFEPDGRELRLLRRWQVDGRGLRVGEAEAAAYEMVFEQTGGPAVRPLKSAMGAPRLAEVRISPKELRAQTGWVDYHVLSELLTTDWVKAAEPLALSAIVRLESLVVRDGRVAEVAVGVDALECAIPVETDVPQGESSRHFLQLRGGRGTIRYLQDAPGVDTGESPAGRVAMELEAAINDGRLRATGFASPFPGTAFSGSPDSSPQASLGALSELDVHVAIEQITLPHIDGQPGFVTSERLPAPVRAFFYNYDPRGRVNLDFRARRSAASRDAASPDAASAPIEFSGRIEALAAAARPRHFPYHWRDVTGIVRFSPEGIGLEALSGRHGSARLRVSGHVNHAARWTGFSLTIDGKDVPLDGELYQALPAEYRALWRDADPTGLADVAISLERDEGTPQEGPRQPRLRLDARLNACSLTVGEDLRLHGVDGRLTIDDGVLTVHELHGERAGSTLRLSGTIPLRPAPGMPERRMFFEAAGARFERSAPLQGPGGEALGAIRLAVVGDLWGTAERVDGATRLEFAVRVADGELAVFDPSRPFRAARGWIAVGGQRMHIHELTASRGADQIQITGEVSSRLALDEALRLDVRARSAAMDELLMQLTPGRWSQVREALGVAGAGRLTLALIGEPAAEGGNDLRAEAKLAVERMQPPPLPLALREVDAELLLNRRGYELLRATAVCGPQGRLELRGGGSWDGTAAAGELFARLEQIEVDAAFVEAMPAPLARVLRRVGVRATADGTLDRICIQGTGPRAWDCVGRLRLHGANLRLGLPLTDAEGELSGNCHVDANGQTALELDFSVARGVLAGRAIERWEGRVTGVPGESWLRIDDLRGRLADGEVFGFARFDPATGAHELSLTLHDLKLAELLRPRPGTADRPREGRLDGRVFVRGESDDPARRVGGGELRIRAASLLSSPVTASIFDVSPARGRPGADAVDEAEVHFVWEGSELKLSRVDIRSRNLRLVGEGRWDMRSDRLSMTLLGAAPEDAPRLAVFTELFESAGRELMQFRVEGTVEHPRVSVEPLHNLTEPLRRLLSANGG